MLPLIIGFAVVVLVVLSARIVPQKQVHVVERFGKYNRMLSAGLNFIIPFVEQVVHKQTMRVRQLDTSIESKTQDNVFVKVMVSVQYRVENSDAVYNSFYQLEDPDRQMRTYIFNVVRAQIPQQKLDEVFDNKDLISNRISEELTDTMGEYGFIIVASLVSDIEPDAEVKASMNRINAAERERRAAEHDAEAKKIIAVKQAEAERDSKILQGEGVSGQRQRIAEGLKSSIDLVCDESKGVTAADVIDLLKFTNHVDMMTSLGGSSTKVIIVPQPSGTGMDMSANLMSAMEASATSKKSD